MEEWRITLLASLAGVGVYFLYAIVSQLNGIRSIMLARARKDGLDL